MAEKFLRDYQCCLDCLTTSQITKDHIVPKLVGKVHSEILKELVLNRRNLAPLCIDHHRRIDRLKFKAYATNGLAGLINFLGENYPMCSIEEILLVQRSQFNFIFSEIADKINVLDSDISRLNRKIIRKH